MHGVPAPVAQRTPGRAFQAITGKEFAMWIEGMFLVAMFTLTAISWVLSRSTDS